MWDWNPKAQLNSEIFFNRKYYETEKTRWKQRKNVQNRYVIILTPELRRITPSTRHDYQPFDFDICQTFIYVPTLSVFILFTIF